MKLLAVFLLVSSVIVQASVRRCPYGWTFINNRCFVYVPNKMSWADAEVNCQSMKLNLASIHSMNEYRQVQNLIAASGHGFKTAWIGGSNAQQENTWLWSDGSRMSYTKWCPGQLDNLGINQNCLMMNYSDGNCWDDIWCHFHRPSVCATRPCPSCCPR